MNTLSDFFKKMTLQDHIEIVRSITDFDMGAVDGALRSKAIELQEIADNTVSLAQWMTIIINHSCKIVAQEYIRTQGENCENANE